jgi:crotonobetainyl-CoA:carnitine CoA-transferase CaiB-like acyl-CoA transferase
MELRIMDRPGNQRGPLTDVRVLEFSQIVAGPVAGLNLADLGAEVIKVEPPAGDPHRFVGTTVPGESKMFQGNNRGKRGLVVDLQQPDGLALIRKLMPTVDVVIINYRPGVAARLGIDYGSLKKLRPDLIYAQISGFGETRPGARWAGSDLVAQAHSGLMVMDAKVDAAATSHAMGNPIADYATGLAIAMAVSAALFHRARTGEGQYISTSLLRAALHLQNRYVMREPVSDATLRDPMVERLRQARAHGADFGELLKIRDPRAGLASPFSLYYRVYRARDGAVALGALTPQNRDAIRRVLGVEGEGSDVPEFDASDPANLAVTEEWRRHIEALMASRRVDEWMALFETAGIPVARVNFPEEMSDDLQANIDHMFLELEHTVTGPQRVVGPVVVMSATPTGSPQPAPALGEYTADILRELGIDDDEIVRLRRAGIVRCLEWARHHLFVERDERPEHRIIGRPGHHPR